MQGKESLKELLKSKNEQDVVIAEQIAIGMGLNWLDIFKLKHETGAMITNEDAIKAKVIDDHCCSIQKCFKCESEDFETKVIDTLQGRVCEEETICKKCGNSTYWGYGHFDFNNIV